MQPRLQRLLVFFGLCAAFGAAVWASEVVNINSHSLLAATNVAAPLVGETEKQCPSESLAARYDKSKPWNKTFKDENGNQVLNLYGKDCYQFKKEFNVTVKGHCVGPNNCHEDEFVGEDKKLHPIENPEKDPGSQVAGPGAPSGGGGAIMPPSEHKPNAPSPYPTGPTLPESSASPPTPPPSTPVAAPAAPAPATAPAPTPASRIGDIAKSGGPAPGGPANAGRPTFSPSPALSNSPFSLGSLFGSRGGSGEGSPGGMGSTLAYVPVNQYPGLTSPNFDTRGTGITFPPPQPSPSDVLAYLAQNTKRVKADGFTAEELADRGVVNTGVLQAINNVVTPMGDFIRSFFSSEDVGAPSGSEVSRAARDERPPLERGKLVLTLAPGDTLVAGDPTELLVGRPDKEYETFESIPSSNRAWVQNAPRAADEIEGIGSAPLSYGWGEPPQSDGRAGAGGASAPQVSDVSYEPFPSLDRIVPAISGGESVREQPRSFFSVMAKSFGTIVDAVGNLFANIGKVLFWWL